MSERQLIEMARDTMAEFLRLAREAPARHTPSPEGRAALHRLAGSHARLDAYLTQLAAEEAEWPFVQELEGIKLGDRVKVTSIEAVELQEVVGSIGTVTNISTKWIGKGYIAVEIDEGMPATDATMCFRPAELAKLTGYWS